MEPGAVRHASYRERRGWKEVVTLDGAGETLTMAGAGHVDQLTHLEHFDGDGVANLQLAQLGGVQSEFVQTATSFDASAWRNDRLRLCSRDWLCANRRSL